MCAIKQIISGAIGALSLLWGSASFATDEISLVCHWEYYSRETDSFIVNIQENSAYWINEDKRLTLDSVNEGRIEFEGTRTSLLVSDGKYKNNVKLRYIINRVTGELSIGGIDMPKGYNSICMTTKKLF